MYEPSDEEVLIYPRTVIPLAGKTVAKLPSTGMKRKENSHGI